MLRFLRRSRLVAVLLLLAMPGTGGTLVQAAHPCADKAPWTVAADSGGDHARHAPDAGQADDAGPGTHRCECVGACASAAGAAGPAATPAITFPAFAGRPPAVPGHRHDAPRPRPHRLLPPANAPPLA